jgi:Transglutaminase-like superfamily
VSAVTPNDLLARLAPADRARVALEVLATYVRVRRTMHADDDVERAVAKLRQECRSEPLQLDAHGQIVAALRLARMVRRVLSVLPSDSRCLFRSLTLLCMLERRGVAQRLVIAVRSQPFGAHAWIEVGGRAVLPAGEPGDERLLEL